MRTLFTLRRVAGLPLRAALWVLSRRFTRKWIYFCAELPLDFLTGRIPGRVWWDNTCQALPVRWRAGVATTDTTYVFIFLGEFGYELFNWQGVVRRFSEQNPAVDVAVAGRSGLDLIYETASSFIDITGVELFQQSVAASYFALPPFQLRRYHPPSVAELLFDHSVRRALVSFISDELRGSGRRLEFVFSSSARHFRQCVFGVDRFSYGFPFRVGPIYYGEPAFCGFLKNNSFVQLHPDLSMRSTIEEQLGLSLETPYVLIQGRQRSLGPQAGGRPPLGILLEELCQQTSVVFLSFDTGRAHDSSSSFSTEQGLEFLARSFREQACLISFANTCLFLTEGDLGSHTYLPPFFGKDVVVLASRDIFTLPSAPIEFWNRTVFRWGGQMIPWSSEEVLSSSDSLRRAVRGLLPE